MKNQCKIFVLDTNVILHDFNAINNFQDNDVVLPITVLEEIDNFKKGNELINFHAREFMRILNALVGDNFFNEGISLGKGKGKLIIEATKQFSPEMEASFGDKIPDHRILSVADWYTRNLPDRNVVMVTQDVNFRMKAKSIGVQAEDYKTGKVQNVEHIKEATEHIANVPEALIAQLYKNEKASASEFEQKYKFVPNQCLVLSGTNGSTALVFYNRDLHEFRLIQKRKFYGIEGKNAEQTFALEILSNPDIPLVSVTGVAGTGKTLLALAAALEMRQKYQQIYLARPIVALANKDMGFLPGDEKSKIGPYMQPLFDNLSVIKHQFPVTGKDYTRIDDMLKTEKLLITPLAYIRGRSLSNVCFIVDEAQNLTPHEIKTIITRAGENCKMIFTGDINQIDSPYLDSKSNGLSYLADRMKGQDLFAHINLVKGERSKLAELAGRLL
ncbi:MAG TPA: ribonuclease [Bacteroidales bacterium]|nr:ribonuclease [Bacteroidales bacterium]